MAMNCTTSSIPWNPTLRSSCLNTVVVVPLLSSSSPPTKNKNTSITTHSDESFETLFSSLSTFATHSSSGASTRRGSGSTRVSYKGKSHRHNAGGGSSRGDLTLIIPNSQLTRPGEWRYDTTPLKDHDWSVGYQRMVVFDGRDYGGHGSQLAHERLSSSTSSLLEGHGGNDSTTNEPMKNKKKSQYGDFVDLYPYRGISAVIGVLNVRDCKSADDLLAAERELAMWKARFTPRLYCDRSKPNDHFAHSRANGSDGGAAANGSLDNVLGIDVSPMDPSLFVTQRLFVFDSFEDGVSQELDLNQTKVMGSGELVAFPPIESMDVHVNLVMNDLAVAIFMSLERRISALNQMVAATTDMATGKAVAHPVSHHTRTALNGNNGIQNSGNAVANGKSASTVSNTKSGNFSPSKKKNHPKAKSTSTKQEPTPSVPPPSSSSAPPTTTTSTSTSTSTSTHKGPMRGLRSIAASAVKAINHKAQQISSNHRLNNNHAAINPNRYLSTPLDHSTSVPTLTTPKTTKYRTQRNVARTEKYCADLALLAGSPVDAYKRYLRAAELTKSLHDPLWHAASMEGIAISYVAMSDCGGHGADEYLSKSFQYPEEIMLAARGGTADAADAAADESGKKDPKFHRNKTTMPNAVLAYLEEACEIVSHHTILSNIYSELLLKMAWYIAELEGLHLRCRWGEGFFPIDDHNNRSKQVNRLKHLKILSKSELRTLQEKGILYPLLGDESIKVFRRLTDLLHRSVSISTLDTYTRASVAGRCAKLCLRGVQIPTWTYDMDDNYNNPSSFRKPNAFSMRFPFPRKAGFFMVIAANSMAQCTAVGDAHRRAARFWDAASILYSKEGNRFDCNKTYAWATLRASVLHALSLQNDCHSAELAMKQLLMLLAEISPESATLMIEDKNLDFSTHTASNGPSSGVETMQQDMPKKSFADLPAEPPVENGAGYSGGGTGSNTNGNNQKKDIVTQRKVVPARSAFFVHLGSAHLSENSKWLEDEPVPMLQLPLIESSSMVEDNLPTNAAATTQLTTQDLHSYKLAPSLISLNCVVPKMKFEDCVAAQRLCIAHLSSLRHTMATSSFDGCQYMEGTLRKEMVPYLPPLEIISATIVKSESHLLLDRTKAAGFNAKTNESLRTFFNPYDSRAKDESLGKNLITVVAEGEERTIEITLSNRLSIAVDIPSCQLEFDKSRTIEIEAPPLSFTIPPNQQQFVVHFPFIVVDSTNRRLGYGKNGMTRKGVTSNNRKIKSSMSSMTSNSFEVIGIRVSCFNRNISIPFEKSDNNDDATNKSGNAVTKTGDGKHSRRSLQRQMPDAASIYQWACAKAVSDRPTVRLERVPAQPNLLVSFSTSPTPLPDATLVPVHLSDGEIYTIPAFRLENDFGPSGSGRMERLQIVGVGLPGLPDEILFDTDEMAKALEEEEDNFSETDSEDQSTAFEELMESDGLPPLKMKCLAGNLSLKSINDMSNFFGEGSLVRFQIAATHDMGNQLANGGNIRIRFRYRGLSSSPGVEIWRKREVNLQIIRVKGPRLSSLTLRSDLSWGSAYADLCRSLAHQLSQLHVVRNWESSKQLKMNSSVVSNEDSLIEQYKDTVLHNVGINQGVFVSGDNIVVLMAVANETNSTIILSNRIGMVGGFESSPMPTVRVTSGVSVKIPVVIPRIDCLDENGDISDIATELIARTALQWESEVDKAGDSVNSRVRQGRVRIPSRCLREIIEEHKSFATRICKPPVAIDVFVGNCNSNSEVVIYPGFSLDTVVKASMQDWVPSVVLAGCSISLEFCCARRDSGGSALTFEEENIEAYFWCGQIRKSVSVQKSMDHCARICFLKPGEYVVSACVKISGENGPAEETWWAPLAKSVTVERIDD